MTQNGGIRGCQHPELKQFAYVHPGRLAPHRSPDAEPRLPLRLHRRLGDRPDQEPELRHPAERRPRRTLRGSAGVRGFRTRSEGRHQQLSRPRIGLAWNVDGNGRDVVRVRLRPLLRRRLHQRQHSVRRGQCHRHRRRDRSSPSAIRTGSSRPTARSSASATIRPRLPRRTRPVARCRSTRTSPRRGSSSRTPTSTSVGWSRQLDASTVVDVDYIHSDGRDLGWRLTLNHRNPGVGATGPATVCRPSDQPGQLHHRHQRWQEPL